MIDKFKRDHIYTDIMRTERDERSMMTWLQTLALHTFAVDLQEPTGNRSTAGESTENVTKQVETNPTAQQKVCSDTDVPPKNSTESPNTSKISACGNVR